MSKFIDGLKMNMHYIKTSKVNLTTLQTTLWCEDIKFSLKKVFVVFYKTKTYGLVTIPS